MNFIGGGKGCKDQELLRRGIVSPSHTQCPPPSTQIAPSILRRRLPGVERHLSKYCKVPP